MKIKIIGNQINEEGCKQLNEILLENKKIEKIDLNCTFFKSIFHSDNNISSILFHFKESLKKNKFLKNINLHGKLFYI
jgi:F0F1-type ATP synthase delta subunit